MYGWDMLLNQAAATNQPYIHVSVNGCTNHRLHWAMYGSYNPVLEEEATEIKFLYLTGCEVVTEKIVHQDAVRTDSESLRCDHCGNVEASINAA